MSNNILQWNPSKNNQQDDATYTTDPMRTGGAVPGIFDKELANKLFYQVTTMCSALGKMMSNKGYNISDADITVLITALSNILTKADFGTTANTVCQGNDSRLETQSDWNQTDIAETDYIKNKPTFDVSLAENGYQKLPGGLILQWGLYEPGIDWTSSTFNFPLEFPNVCFNAIASETKTTSPHACSISVHDKASVNIYVSGVAAHYAVFWQAVGY